MRTDQHQEKKIAIMEKCFACYAKNGLTGTGVKALAEACGCTQGNLYSYFKNLDELIVESTAYCMSKVEDEFMAKAPTDPVDVMRFIEEVPYWTAREHGGINLIRGSFIAVLPCGPVRHLLDKAPSRPRGLWAPLP